ncbi:MAG TPA: alpha/beta hydrolase [Baekduia sp.]|nr:alpha/beta hydrolase [Baekduia sp.]
MEASTSIEPHRGGSGEPLVLIHGFTSSWRNWLPVLPALEEHNDVLAVRLAGHYDAAAFPDGVEASVESLTDAVERDMDEADFERARVVGNSLGGWIALELAKRGRAVTVVAMSPAGGWNPASPELRRLERTFKTSHKLAGWLAPHADTLMRSRLARRVVFSRVAARPERIPPEEAAYRVRALAGCGAFQALLATIGRDAPPRGLDGVDCPVLLIWPTHDRILPKARYARYFLDALPKAELQEPHGLGHVPTFDDPDVIVRSILDFTARHPIDKHGTQRG